VRTGWQSTQLRSQSGTQIRLNSNRTHDDLKSQQPFGVYPQVVGDGVSDVWIEVRNPQFTGHENVHAVFLPVAGKNDLYETVDLQYFGDHYAGRVPTSFSVNQRVDATPFAYDWAPTLGVVGSQLGDRQEIAIEDGKGPDGWEKDPVNGSSNFQVSVQRD
jgi:hypothetical protein